MDNLPAQRSSPDVILSMDETAQRREAFARSLIRWRQRRLSRRDFVRGAILAGFGCCLPSLFGCRRSASQTRLPDPGDTTGPDSAIHRADRRRFLEAMGRRFKGTTLRIVSEDTPSSVATRKIMLEEFIPLSGIDVEWELLPLDRVLAKLSSATARRVSTHDVFYVDQQWVARFADDFVEPDSLFTNEEIAFPDYRFDDILPELVNHVATYQGRLVGIPYDTTIEILMYRRDILEALSLPVPRTRQEYLETARLIAADPLIKTYGTTGMWKAGHLALYIEFVSLLWGHGGSVYRSNGEPALNDEAALACLHYMRELSETMPPAVTTWDWTSEARSFAMGESALLIQPGEYLSMINNPRQSQVAGLVDVAPCPAAIRLRPPEACGYGERPGVSHQGGSLLCLSRYSRNVEAAWVFIQWATSEDVTSRACILGGGSSPIRTSNYSDPRVLALGTTPTGPTYHFPVALEEIRHSMGCDPKLPEFPDIAVNGLAVELGRFTTGQQSAMATAEAMQRAARVRRSSFP